MGVHQLYVSMTEPNVIEERVSTHQAMVDRSPLITYIVESFTL